MQRDIGCVMQVHYIHAHNIMQEYYLNNHTAEAGEHIMQATDAAAPLNRTTIHLCNIQQVYMSDKTTNILDTIKFGCLT